MEGRRVNHSAPKRNPLYVMFLCLVAAVFVLLIVVIVLGAKLGAAQKAAKGAETQIEELQEQVVAHFAADPTVKVFLFGGGKVALIWNSRVEDSPIVREEGNIHRLYCPCFYGFSGGLEKLTDSIGAFFNHRFQVFRFPNDLSYTREQYLRRMMSTSYALTEGGEERSSWLGALEKLFDRFETEGRVTVPNETVVYLGKC